MTSDTDESRSHEAMDRKEDRAEIAYINGRIALTAAGQPRPLHDSIIHPIHGDA
jgi:hypothetical protein